jgi:aminopeptidase N
MHKLIPIAVILLTLGACQQATTVSRDDVPGLTQEYAAFRAAQVKDVRYDLDVELDPALESFSGRNRIEFELLESSSDLTIDFSGGDVIAVIVNGTGVDVHYNNTFITIDEGELHSGRNEIVIQFAHTWSPDGNGLYRYRDLDDDNFYVYSFFEPYAANNAFPLIDQPDIKARLTLSVTVPSDWNVISTTRESSMDMKSDTTNTWHFPETPPIPTYVMPLHAGPYVVWEDSDFRIPLRLFARQSLAEFVGPDSGKWFDYTRSGFDFLEDYFDIEYPYGKYDQVLVPDLGGAMENVAAVTFDDYSFVQRDSWTPQELRNFQYVVLHEMTHMWFGDLVTMKWWNDLWLNESFATLMGYRALATILDDEGIWQSFFVNSKASTYWFDLRRTTHPIEVSVPDIETALATRDSITYVKGASVLRQIEYRLGNDEFRAGVNAYLTEHSASNARLADFIAALEQASGADLDTWSQEWLQTAGPNTVEANFVCENDRIVSFVLLQSAPAEHPVMRTQKIKLGLFRDIDGVVTTDSVIDVTYSGEATEVPGAVGKACPDLVYPNYGDLGYLLVKLDSRTLKNLNNMIARVEDSFQRSMFWQSLRDNVRYAQISITDFLDIVFASVSEDDDIDTVYQLYGYVVDAIGYLRTMGESQSAVLDLYRSQAESLVWANAQRTHDDLQTLYFDRYLGVASSQPELERFVALLEDELEIPGYELNQEERWWMLYILSAGGHERTDELLAKRKARGLSGEDHEWVVWVESAWPSIAVKRRIIDDWMNPESETTFAMQQQALASMFPTGQQALREVFADEVFAQILENEKNLDPAFFDRARSYAARLIPMNCTPESVDRLERAIADHANSRDAIKNTLIQRYEDDSLCVQRAALLN